MTIFLRVVILHQTRRFLIKQQTLIIIDLFLLLFGFNAKNKYSFFM